MKSVRPTRLALAGHFAGDGSVSSCRRRLEVFTMDLDTAVGYKRHFGGTNTRHGKGWRWRSDPSRFDETVGFMAPHAWTKSAQLRRVAGVKRWTPELKAELQDLKRTEDPTSTDVPVSGTEMDQVVAGFLTADGHTRSYGKSHRASVVFTQKKPGVLEVIKAHYPGGRIYRFNPKCSGRTHNVNGEMYEAHRLVFNGSPAYAILNRLFPFIASGRVRSRAEKVLVMHELNL